MLGNITGGYEENRRRTGGGHKEVRSRRGRGQKNNRRKTGGGEREEAEEQQWSSCRAPDTLHHQMFFTADVTVTWSRLLLSVDIIQ